MLGKIALLVFAALLGMLVESLLGLVAGALWGLIPEGWDRLAHAAAFLETILGEAARFAVTGFVFWSGSRASVRTAAAWAVLGGIALEPLFYAVTTFSLRAGAAAGLGMARLSIERPIFMTLVLLARSAGGFLGARFGDERETDEKVHLLQEMLFRLYPFRLPR